MLLSRKFTLPEEFLIPNLMEFSNHPHDLWKIAVWLAKHGEVTCSARHLEICWIFFSSHECGVDWLKPTRRNIRKFAKWGTTLRDPKPKSEQTAKDKCRGLSIFIGFFGD